MQSQELSMVPTASPVLPAYPLLVCETQGKESPEFGISCVCKKYTENKDTGVPQDCHIKMVFICETSVYLPW